MLSAGQGQNNRLVCLTLVNPRDQSESWSKCSRWEGPHSSHRKPQCHQLLPRGCPAQGTWRWACPAGSRKGRMSELADIGAGSCSAVECQARPACLGQLPQADQAEVFLLAHDPIVAFWTAAWAAGQGSRDRRSTPFRLPLIRPECKRRRRHSLVLHRDVGVGAAGSDRRDPVQPGRHLTP